jgi:protein-S-isoprenylcysteine O-methyltransferase Ste14
MSHRILPPVYLLAGLVCVALLHVVLPGPRLIEGPWRLLGVPMAALGAVVTVRADALFKRLGTEVKPFLPSRLVVMEGPFRRSRHPMYLGFMAMILGMAILAGTLAPLLLAGVMFWLFSVVFVIPEERHMEEQFGDDYRRYRAQVRRWL